MQGVIVGWQVYKITNNPFSLGLIGLFEAIPFLTIALFAGHIADIIKRKTIIIYVNIALFLSSLTLLFFTLDIAPAYIKDNVSLIYSVIFITGIARGFIGPALFAYMPQIVENKKLYSNAISWNTSIWQVGSIAGPSLAGVIYMVGELQIVYLIITVLLVLSLIQFSFIKQKPLPEYKEETNVQERLLAGIKFVFKNEIILSAISLDLFAVLFGGAIALLPVFASDILKVGAQGLGFLRAAPGVGAVLMVIVLAYFPIHRNAGIKMLLAVAAFGVCMILFGLSTNFWLSLGLLVLSGAFDSISVIVRSNLVHTLTPEYMKGRVSAVNNFFVGSSNELGAFESGAMAALIGIVPAVVSGGVLTLLIVGFTAHKAKSLLKLNL
jgi:MFS family permease